MRGRSSTGGTSAPAVPSAPGRRRVGVARVVGESMRPTLAPGDRLLVRYGVAPVPGDVVVARFVDGTMAVKRVEQRRETRDGRPGWWLLSDNPEQGVDSRHRGVVPDDQVLAVVLGRLWPWPPRVARRSNQQA